MRVCQVWTKKRHAAKHHLSYDFAMSNSVWLDVGGLVALLVAEKVVGNLIKMWE